MKKFNNYPKLYHYIEPLTDNDPDLNKRYQLSNCFQYLEDYLNLAGNQYERIMQSMNTLDTTENCSEELSNVLLILFGDIHFMLIALEKAYLLSVQLLNLLDHTERAKSIETATHYLSVKRIRNCLEHMDENMVKNDSKHNKLIEPHNWYTNWFTRQWGTLIDGQFFLGEYSFKLSESSFQPLWELYEDILDYINKLYVQPNKDTVDKLFAGLKENS